MGLDETAAKKTGYPTWKWLLKEEAGSVFPGSFQKVTLEQ